MKCPNCKSKFSLWELFKLSNLFRVTCSSCSHEIVKDTSGFKWLNSTILTLAIFIFLVVLMSVSDNAWVIIWIVPIQLYFDYRYAALRSLGDTSTLNE